MFVWMVLSLFALLAEGNITGQNPPNGACLCINTRSMVRIRNPACGRILGNARNGQCFRYKGRKQRCSLSGRSYEFFNINFNGRDGWSAGNWMRIGSASQCVSRPPPTGNCRGARVINRRGWGARPPRRIVRMRTPVRMVFIHHTVTAHCTTRAACIRQMRNIQRFHMDSRRYSDIGYSWLVGEDGHVYEGRGWNKVGGHTLGYNSVAVAISFIGNFQNRNPNARAVAAAQNIIACGVRQGQVARNYELFGHRSGGCTACPGNRLWAQIQRWPRFSRRRIRRYGCGG